MTYRFIKRPAFTHRSTPQSKYGNILTEYNGRVYHSALEARYAQRLDWRLRAKEFHSWEPQVSLPLEVNGRHVCDYIIDFVITHHDGRIEYVEVKGMSQGSRGTQTDTWRLKWNLLEALLNGNPMYKMTLETNETF